MKKQITLLALEKRVDRYLKKDGERLHKLRSHRNSPLMASTVYYVTSEDAITTEWTFDGFMNFAEENGILKSYEEVQS